MGYFADKRLSIVIPAYNEEQVIGRVLDEIISLNVADEIIVVNDGSRMAHQRWCARVSRCGW